MFRAIDCEATGREFRSRRAVDHITKFLIIDNAERLKNIIRASPNVAGNSEEELIEAFGALEKATSFRKHGFGNHLEQFSNHPSHSITHALSERSSSKALGGMPLKRSGCVLPF